MEQARRESASIEDSELVFVGYGIVAPEFSWDDYKDVDVTGKTLVMLVNDPPVAEEQNPSELDPRIFGGKAMTYYGRWTLQVRNRRREARSRCAAHSRNRTAGYPVRRGAVEGQRAVRPRDARQEHGARRDRRLDHTRSGPRSSRSWPGKDFEDLKRQAASRDFQPIPLGVTASMTIKNKLRTINSPKRHREG